VRGRMCQNKFAGKNPLFTPSHKKCYGIARGAPVVIENISRDSVKALTMRRLLFVLSCSGCLPLMWMPVRRYHASSNSNTPTPAIGMHFARRRGTPRRWTWEPPNHRPSPRRTNPRHPACRPSSRLSMPPNRKPRFLQQARAEAAPPSGNFFSQMLSGKKQPAKRVPLPLAEVSQSRQPTTKN